MPIYSPTGFLDVTNATLRTSNLEAENFKLNGGNIYVSTDFTVAPTLQLITNGGSVTSNTVEFTNPTTGLVVDSNIVVTGNVTAGYLYGDASNVTAVPAAQITGTLAVANGGTGTTTSTGTGSVVLSDAPTFTGDVTFDTNTLFVDSANDRVGVGTKTPGTTLDVLGNGAFLHAGSGTPHNSNDLILRLGGLNNGGGIIQSKCAIIATPDMAYGGEADYGRNAIHFCIDNSQTDTNASKSNHRISIKPDGLVGIRNANPVKRLHIKGYSNEILAGLDHVTAANDEHVGLGFGVTDGSQGNRIFKGGIFFERKGGITGRGDLLFCIENTGDNTSEVSPANEIMRITRNSVVGITGNLSVTGNATFDTDTLFVDSVNDRVGIGTTSPGASLDVNGGAIFSGGGPVINCTTNNPGDMISKRYASADRYGMGQYAGGVTRLFTSTAYAAGKICLSGATDDVTTANAGFTDYVTIENNGDVGIGTTIPEAVLDVRSGTTIPRLRGDAGRSLFMGSNYTHVNSTGFSETSTNYAWDGYPGVIRMNSSGEYRFHGQTGTYTVVVRADGGFVPFTGLHETYLPFDEDDQGKIVYSTGDYASELKDGNVDGVICDYLTVLDACPVVKICATENDKRVMGVLSTRHRRTQIKEISKEEYELITGDEKYAYEKKEGTDVYIRDIDTDEFSRGYYNAVGEGGIWVCNKNGNLENGDYITSSTVAGYGQKQNDDLLHNYTVAKITTDCDFTEIWVTTKKHKKTREGYLFDENNEPVYENILDTEGNTQNHLKFKLRYLLPDGTQISEEEYTTKTLAGEKVYVAAFVGCTYHCG